jgi:DNA-binding LacI/PurR family transcriptional regulator
MAVRLKDIADKLNVSISTVSYALNGGARQVPEEVRLRVEQTARELGYRPNRLARSLAAGRTMTLGVVPVATTPGMTLVPFFQSCFNGIVNELEHRQYDVLLYTHLTQASPDRQADTLLDGRVDGIIFLAPVKDSPIVPRVVASGLPHSVVFGTVGDSTPCINADNEGGIRAAVEHVAGLGHRQIAHIHGDLSMLDGSQRLDSFRESTARLGIEVRPKWIVDGAFTPTKGYEAARMVLAGRERPSAIVCANDEMAVGVYRAASELGVRIPEDLSVTGFDDVAAAQILLPNLTTLAQPMEEMGAAAARAVLDSIGGKPAESKRFETKLVVRDSTAAPR